MSGFFLDRRPVLLSRGAMVQTAVSGGALGCALFACSAVNIIISERESQTLHNPLDKRTLVPYPAKRKREYSQTTSK